MKILLASDGYKFQTNGVSGVVIALEEKLRSFGHEVKVIALSNTSKSFRDGDEYFLASFKSVLYPDVRHSLIRSHPFLKEIVQWKPDVVHIHTEGSAAAMARRVAKTCGAPIVMTMHTDYAKFAFPNHSEAFAVKKLAKAFSMFVYRGGKVMSVPSEKAKDLLRGYLPTRPIVVIPNGINLERFGTELSADERAALFEKYGLEDNGKLLVIVSRLSAEKRIEEILEFFPDLLRREPDARLLIAGGGPDEENLHRIAQTPELRGKVVFTGRIPPEEVYRYYKLGSVFLSASEFEMHSLTYLEAMACGVPLICRDDTCLKGVLDDGYNGYRYTTKDEFIDKSLSILTDSELQARLSRNALERSAEFSQTAYAERTLDLYKSLCDFTAIKKARELI